MKLPESLLALLGRSETGHRISESWSFAQDRGTGKLNIKGIDIDQVVFPHLSSLQCLEHSVLHSDAALSKPSDEYHMRCAGGIVDAAAEIVQSLVKKEGDQTSIMRLSLCAINFVPVSTSSSSIAHWLTQTQGGNEQHFSRAKRSTNATGEASKVTGQVSDTEMVRTLSPKTEQNLQAAGGQCLDQQTSPCNPVDQQELSSSSVMQQQHGAAINGSKRQRGSQGSIMSFFQKKLRAEPTDSDSPQAEAGARQRKQPTVQASLTLHIVKDSPHDAIMISDSQ
eukprot:2348349-Rhodomonas_salina.3